MIYLLIFIWPLLGLMALIPMRNRTGYVPLSGLVIAFICGPIAALATLFALGFEIRLFEKKD